MNKVSFFTWIKAARLRTIPLSISGILVGSSIAFQKNEFDLVQLNLNSSFENKRKISIKKKENVEKSIKTLSKNEIKDIKNKIAKKNKKNKTKKNKLSVKSENKLNNISKKSVKVNKNIYEVVDVCTIIEKCSIEEISKYLIDQGNERDYPDITIKERKL